MDTTETFERFYCDTVRDIWVLYECLKTIALTPSDEWPGGEVETDRRQILARLAQVIADLDQLSFCLATEEQDSREETTKEIQARRLQFLGEREADMAIENIAYLLKRADRDGIASIEGPPAHERRVEDMEMRLAPEEGRPEQ